ncbi:MAG: hypothetical protein ACI88C_001603, partial [Acidimicrobiales bacterium]
PLCYLTSEAAHLVEGAGTVRITISITEVHEILVWQQVDQRSSDSKTAKTTIEDANRLIVHANQSTDLQPLAGGTTVPTRCPNSPAIVTSQSNNTAIAPITTIRDRRYSNF